MNLDENIKNAFAVVKKTHENIAKLIAYVRGVATDYGYAPLHSPEFLRWRSDAQSDGWCINGFILLFQPTAASECQSKNGWKDAPMYALELNFYDEPRIYLYRLDYAINEWGNAKIGAGDHWQIYYTRCLKKDFFIEEKDGYTYSVPRDARVKETYWKIRSSVSKKGTFTDITRDNVKEKIFDVFDELAAIEL